MESRFRYSCTIDDDLDEAGECSVIKYRQCKEIVETVVIVMVKGAPLTERIVTLDSSLNVRSFVTFRVGILLGSTIAFLLVRLTAVIPQSNEIDLSHHSETMYDCTERVFKAVAASKISPGLYDRVWKLCGNQIFNGLYLDDFIIRRRKFIDQEFDERVNLWLVVTITISGVVMSGLQLLMSYRLANRGRDIFSKDSELAIESGKISL